MIDINNSQDYDPDSFNELLAEERQKTGVLAAHGGLSLGGPGLLAARLALESTRRAREDAAKEITDPIEFMKLTYPNQTLFRYIQTHPDLDHMRGLKRLHENIGFINFWDTAHAKPTPDFKSDGDKEDWEFYQSLRKGTVGGVSVHNFTRGDQRFAFAREEDGLPGGDNIEILSPTPALVSSSNDSESWNDLSLALRVRHGNRSVLLPGDAEAEAWKEMVSHYGKDLKSDYLKASHHGRDSGYDLAAVKLIAPRVTFVSVGRKPDTDASSKYRQQCPKVASTRFHGDMELQFLDDGGFNWYVARNA